ncbi:MAG TPA: OB-fold nucleic acid binding domain-containing protein [Anaerolineae bacterium]|nr:OB-fold nucleic acid binding domain-containing protein [Anaerolineae bacterium]
MSDSVTIEQIAGYAEREVTIRGWLYARNGKSKLQILQVRDGTGVLPCVLMRKEVPPEVFDAAQDLGQESSLIVTGTIRTDDRAGGIPGGYEMEVRDLEVIQAVKGMYPLSLQDRGPEFLAQNRHLWVRSARQWATLRIRGTIIQAIRGWLDGHGFLPVDAPVPEPAGLEEPQGLLENGGFRAPDSADYPARLYGEANIMAFGRVYSFGPTFRTGRGGSRRHLQEMWGMEAQAAFVDLAESMAIQEQLVTSAVQEVLATRSSELELLGRSLAPLEAVVPPFSRMSYDDAVALINRAASEEVATPSEDTPLLPVSWGAELSVGQSAYLVAQLGRPVFVHHPPSSLCPFYVAQEPNRPETCRSSALLVAEGYGEVVRGSEPSTDLAFLEAEIDRHGLPREAYEWYLDLRRFGSVPHSGFGLELEQVVAWICGLGSTQEAIPYPRQQGRIYP